MSDAISQMREVIRQIEKGGDAPDGDEDRHEVVENDWEQDERQPKRLKD
jgi:hypothetical protein